MTPTGSCRARGRSSGWPRRTASRSGATPAQWQARWLAEAERFEQAPLPAEWLDPDDLVAPEKPELLAANARMTDRALAGALELLSAEVAQAEVRRSFTLRG